MNLLELRRQILHLVYGPIIVLLYEYRLINLSLLTGVIIGGSIASLLVKRQKLPLVRKALAYFERDHHLESFPGRGILFFTIGAALVLAIFPKEIAYAGILILSAGDAVTNVVGRNFGRIKTRLNPNKSVEGTFTGVLVSIPIAYYFSHNPAASIAAACIAMFLEMPTIKIGSFEIDDNLLIPLGASLTLSLF